MEPSRSSRLDPTGRRRLTRRRRRRRRVLAIVALLLSPVVYSYVTTMMKPSSLPLGIRSVEWIRSNGGAWLVNDVERYYYRWTAPSPGGPTLTTLPQVVTGPNATKPTKVARASYRPPRVRPAILPALAREGSWYPTGPNVKGGPPVLVTEFRSNATYPRIVAYVAWIDHTRTDIGYYPGRYEPPAGSPRGPMQVPYGERWRLLATFNAGFTYNDGHGGSAIDGHSYEPLQRGMGTLVGYRNGRVNVISWRGGPVPGHNIAFARQNLPLIVDHRKPNPNLNDGIEWGATLGNAIRVWRSGVGIDKHGNLIYAAADYQTVSDLAALLIRAGAVRGMQLDINAEWPSFNAYGKPGGQNVTKVVPNTQQSANRYLSPDDRDFFTVYRRVRGHNGEVPFK